MRDPLMADRPAAVHVLTRVDPDTEDAMKTRLRLKPGQNGARKPVQQYGDRLVCVRYRYDERIRFEERDLRERVKSAGAQWDPERLLWLLPLNKAQDLGLEDRIVADE